MFSNHLIVHLINPLSFISSNNSSINQGAPSSGDSVFSSISSVIRGANWSILELLDDMKERGLIK